MPGSERRRPRKSGLTEKPQAGPEDAAHAIVKAVLSAIPVLGGSAAELFAALIQPPLSRRLDRWVERIAKGLEKCEKKVDAFKIENLVDDEAFVTTVMHASQIAIRNHQKEKLEALRNAVLNAALQNFPDEDLQLMFLNCVDALTPWHMRMLRFLDNPKEYGRTINITYPNWSTGSLAMVIGHTFEELRGRDDFIGQVFSDLRARGLIETNTPKGMMPRNSLLAAHTTNMGKQFLQFITSPLDDEEVRA